MKHDALRSVEKYTKEHRWKRRWYQVMLVLSCVVVFCTTYALILPAITLENQCDIPEHTHTDACYTQVTSAEETAGTEPLTCTIPEGEGAHTHGADCYDADGNLICQQEESEGHVHGPRCYGTWELTCGMEEHTHSEECQGAAGLTEEEQAQVDAVIALIDALPGNEEIEETAAAFEEAEDEDGLEAYLSEVYPQVNEAYEAYSALTDGQKAAVTNADKLMELEWIWSAATLETGNSDFPVLTDDSARVTAITVTGISDGVTPWDENDDAGNDSSDSNKIVRTFDTVTYRFEVQMASYDNVSYSEARVKLEFVLPLTSEQAVFDQSAMAWMDQTSGYAPVLTTETRSIDGVGTQCQVLTCYKRLLPSEGHQSVVPGSFGENVTVNVKSMKNGETFAPIFSAAMEYGTWEGDCSAHNVPEKFTVQADRVTISAAPKYNIQIGGQSSYKNTFDFNSGNKLAQAYGDGYGKGNVIGRLVKLGVTLQIYNDNASKGFKGIELPDGSDITFDLKLSSVYTVNTPNAGSTYKEGDKVDVTTTYMPLLWSCDGNNQTMAGTTNSDGRVLYDTHGYAQAWAPSATQGKDKNGCYESGRWTATQVGSTIHITVSGYVIDTDDMPLYNSAATEDEAPRYGEALGIGCFSAGEVWILQPYNKIGDTSANEGPNYDVVQDYGQGVFTTTIEDMNLKATSVGGTTVQDPTDTNRAQMRVGDDRLAETLELTKPGSYQNRIAYCSLTNFNKGVGTDNAYDGKDFAAIGTEIGLLGGFSYHHQNELDNLLYWGTNLTKFYGSAIEIIDEPPDTNFFQGANPKEWMVYYATKQDGTDWKDDYELQHTYEDDMVFYKKLSEIPEGHLCVGLLFCFKEDTFGEVGMPHFLLRQKARVREDMSLAGQTFMLASTSRFWTKAFFESAHMTLDDIPDWSDPNTKLSDFPTRHYKSANIDQWSVWYTKETYAADGSGALGTHNSDWQHWGDTLLVIGYKTGITKNLCQKSDDSTTKSTFNLDANQRVVDFVLQPRTYFDQATTPQALTTNVTIVDTLPKYLTYRPGSSYFGGAYTQTSINGGTQGSISGGELHEPTVTNNADGTQTLTWVIQDVTVGQKMPAIYYSADIGDRNNPDADVPIGTTNLLNTVRITATHDLRQPTTANGNYAEAGIAVTRGSASSFGKYSRQKLVEPDGSIDYVVYFDNNASTGTDVLLLDAMPVSGVNGSHFNGTYTVNSWKLDTTKCDISKLSVYYTMDTQYQGATIDSLGGKDSALTTIKGWTKANVSEDGSVTAMNGQQPVAWAVIGSLESNKGVYVNLQIQLKPEASTADAAVQNNYYVNALSCNDTTITVETQTINRTLEGLTWLDDNADGVQNEAIESRISGVQVSLWKLKDGGNANTETDYAPYCYPGTDTPIVIETGEQVSVLASGADSATVYEQGRYKFTDLPAGTFAVKFTDGNAPISPYIASPANLGGNDTLDSDATAVYSADKTKLERTLILDISMPKAEEMNVVLYESKYHDSGFYHRGVELPATGGAGTTPYTAGGLLLIAAAATLLYIHSKRRKGECASP